MKILYVQHCSAIGGGSWCLFELIRELQRVDKSMECSALLFEEGPLADRLRSIGVPVDVDSGLSAITPLFDGRAHWIAWLEFIRELFRLPLGSYRFYRYCRRTQPDIVHLNTSALFAFALPAKWAGAKKVFLHNREHWWADGLLRPKTGLKNFVVKHFVDQVFSITHAYIDFFGFKDKTTVLPDWPSFDDEEIRDVRKELDISAADFMILVPGGSTGIKGSMQLLKALGFVGNPTKVKVVVLGFTQVLIPSKWKTRMAVTGAVEYSKAMLQMKDAYAEMVFLLSPTLSVKAYMDACDVVVCPFVVPHAAKAALEASVLGKPVIISRNDEAREYVQEYKTGLFVDPLAPKEIAAAIDFLMKFPNVARQFGKNGAKFVGDCFNKTAIVGTLLDIYKK